jgi:hypothetical protein
LQARLLGARRAAAPAGRGLAIAAGLPVAGIPGALLGVALPAILNSGIRSLLSDADEHVCPTDVFTATAAEPRGRPRHPSPGARTSTLVFFRFATTEASSHAP